MTKNEFNDLEDKLKFRAFTVGRLTQLDSIEKVRGRLLKDLEEGDFVSDFLKDPQRGDLLKIAGLGEEKPWYWENVYRTNMQTCYNAGRLAQFAKNPPEFLEFIGIEDSRQTQSICKPRSGIIRPYNDPCWQRNIPPLHYSCRSTIRGIYKAEAEIREIKPTELPSDVTSPQKGFGMSPIVNDRYWDLTESMAARADKMGILKEIRKTAKELGFKSVRLMVNPKDIAEASVVYKSKTGGVVKQSAQHGAEELEENLRIAKRLADEGKTIVLLPRSQTLKSPDALMEEQLWEFKNPAEGHLSSIDRNIKEALKQAPNVYLEINVPVDQEILEKAIHDRVLREPSLKHLGLFYKGRQYRFLRDEIIQKGWKL